MKDCAEVMSFPTVVTSAEEALACSFPSQMAMRDESGRHVQPLVHHEQQQQVTHVGLHLHAVLLHDRTPFAEQLRQCREMATWTITYEASTRDLITSQWHEVQQQCLRQYPTPHILLIELPGLAVDSRPSNNDRRLGTRIQTVIHRSLEAQRHVLLCGRYKGRAWELPAINLLYTDKRLYRTLHNWCRWGVDSGVEKYRHTNRQC